MFGVSLDKFPYKLEFNEEGLIKKEHLEAFSIFSEMLVAYFLRGITQNWTSGNTTNAKNVYFVNVKGSDLQFSSKFPGGARITAIVAPSGKDPFSNDSSDPISVRVSFGSNISLVGPIFRHEDSDLIDRNFPPQFKFLPFGEYSNIVKPVLGVSKLCIDTSGDLGDYYCYLSSDGTWYSLVTPSVFNLNETGNPLSILDGYSTSRVLDILTRFFYRYRGFSNSVLARAGISTENGTFSVSINRYSLPSLEDEIYTTNRVIVSLNVSDPNTVLKISTQVKVFKCTLEELFSKMYIEPIGSNKLTFFSDLSLSTNKKTLTFSLDISNLKNWNSFDTSANGKAFILLVGLVYDAVKDRFVPVLSFPSLGNSPWYQAFHYIDTLNQPTVTVATVFDDYIAAPSGNNFMSFSIYAGTSVTSAYVDKIYTSLYNNYLSAFYFDPVSKNPTYYYSSKSLGYGGLSYSASLFMPLGMLACKKDSGAYKIGEVYLTGEETDDGVSTTIAINPSGSKGIISFYKKGNFSVSDILSPAYSLDSLGSKIASLSDLRYYAVSTLSDDIASFKKATATDYSDIGGSYLGKKFVCLDSRDKISKTLLLPRIDIVKEENTLGYALSNGSGEWYEVVYEISRNSSGDYVLYYTYYWLSFLSSEAQRFKRVKIKIVPAKNSNYDGEPLKLHLKYSPFTRLARRNLVNYDWAKYWGFSASGVNNIEELWVDFSEFDKVSVDDDSFSTPCNRIPSDSEGVYNVIVGTGHKHLILSGINFQANHTKFVLCPTKYGNGSDTKITLLNCEIPSFDITHSRGKGVEVNQYEGVLYHLDDDRNGLPYFSVEIIDSKVTVYPYGYIRNSATSEDCSNPTIYHIGIVPGYDGSPYGLYSSSDRYYMLGGWYLKSLKIVNSSLTIYLSTYSLSIPVKLWSMYCYNKTLDTNYTATINQDFLSPIVIWGGSNSLVIEDSSILVYCPDPNMVHKRWKDNTYYASPTLVDSSHTYPSYSRSFNSYPPFYSVISSSPLYSPSVAKVSNSSFSFNHTSSSCTSSGATVYPGFAGVLSHRNYHPYSRAEIEGNYVDFVSDDWQHTNRFHLPFVIFNPEYDTTNGTFKTTHISNDYQQKTIPNAKDFYSQYIEPNNDIVI